MQGQATRDGGPASEYECSKVKKMTTRTMNHIGGLGLTAEGETGGLRDGATGLIRRLGARLEEHARYRRTRDELSALSDRELDDIGLARGDIERVARRSAI